MIKKNKAILFIYGEGGHQTQINRLLNIRGFPKRDTIMYLSISETEVKFFDFNKQYTLKNIRDKHSILKTFLLLTIAVIKSFSIYIKIISKFDVKLLITTGPGICIIFSLLFKLSGTRIIFFETWSRFYKKSNTGKMMQFIADDFFIQNKELMNIYPKAKFVGLL